MQVFAKALLSHYTQRYSGIKRKLVHSESKLELTDMFSSVVQLIKIT